MSVEHGRLTRWPARFVLLAFPRRFRDEMAADLAALYQDFDDAGKGRGSLATLWELLRCGLGSRLDDARRRWSGSVRTPGRGSDGDPALGSLLRDLVFGLRILRKSPVFTLVAVASLAIGIGANTAVFTVLEATVLRTLPVRAPEELTVLHVAGERDDWPDVSTSGWMLENDAGHAEGSSFSYSMFQRLRAADTPFSDVTAFAQLYRLNIGIGGQAELAQGQVVAGNYHNLLGIRPLRGRLLTEADDDPAAPPAAVISHAFWQTRFGGQEDAVGQEIRINQAPFTVVGITPRGFRGALQLGSVAAVTVPLAHQTPVMRGRELLPRADYWWLHVLGRREAGASLELAEAAAALTFAQSLEADLEISDSPLYVRALPGARGMTEARSLVVGPLLTVSAVVAAVLLIACVNLANLLLARATARGHEIAVRLSLGASRWRVVRQLLAESLLLSFLGAAFGVILALALRDLLLPVLGLYDSDLGLALDWSVLGFTATVATITGLVFGLVPALRATRFELTPALRDERRGTSSGGLKLGRVLLVVQVALSLALLVVAGLFTGSLFELRGEADGFDVDQILTLKIDPRVSGYAGVELTAYYDEVVRRMTLLPGVAAVGLTSHVPASGTMSSTSFRVEGYEPAEDERVSTFVNTVGRGFFDVFGIQARQGRLFGDEDGGGSRPVVVVNQALVDRYLPGTQPLGRRIGLGRGESASEWEIVGVVPNIKYQNLSDEQWPAVHVLYDQLPDGPSAQTVTLRAATGRPEDLAGPALATLRAIDPDVSVSRLATQREVLRENVAAERTFAQLSLGLGSVALMLSCIGLYGILSTHVSRRTREIGVRMAIGARRTDVVRLIMREMLTVAAGAAVGLLVAWFAVRGIESQLYGLEPRDPRVLVIAPLLLLTVAAVAAFLPARQAAGLDPVEALRSE